MASPDIQSSSAILGYQHPEFETSYGMYMQQMAAGVAIVLATGQDLHVNVDTIIARQAAAPDKSVYDLLDDSERVHLTKAKSIVQAIAELTWEAQIPGIDARDAPHIGAYLEQPHSRGNQ